MNSWITFIFSFLVFGLVGQLNQTDARGRKQGEWKKYHPSSNVPAYVGQFKDDKPIGTFTYYYPSNKVKAVITHAENGRSEAYMYHENKKLMAHGIYHHQKKDSVWTHYSPNGRLSFRETYKNDILNGIRTVYYVTGVPDDVTVIMSEQTFVNGRLNGPTKEYFPDGVKKLEGNYKEGRFEGVVKRYHPGGEIHILERWKDGDKHGWWVTYDAMGKEMGKRYFWKGETLEGDELKKHLQNLKEKGINPNH